MVNELTKYNAARRALEAASSVDEVKTMKDKAEALRLYAHQRGDVEMEIWTAEIKIRAIRRIGELSADLETAQGKRTDKLSNSGVTKSKETALKNAGLSKMTAFRCEQVAGIPEADFDEYLAKKVKNRTPVKYTEIIQHLTREKKAENIRAIISMPDAKYRVIYADPPWSYGNNQPDYQTEQRDHYPVLSLGDICELPIRDIAEDNSVLFLWVTSPMLEDSFQVIKAWGFKYKASFVWDKVKHNMGHYNSVRHEFLLVCTRGACMPDVPKLFDSVVAIERTQHSRKPDEFYNIIETIYPHGKKLEMFRRGEARQGWDVYGYEANA